MNYFNIGKTSFTLGSAKGVSFKKWLEMCKNCKDLTEEHKEEAFLKCGGKSKKKNED